MKILDAGTEPVPNSQVLDFIKRKRAQHKREQGEDKIDGVRQQTPHAAHFLTALEKHQAYLSNSKFGHKKSPKYYDHEQDGMAAFRLRFSQLILDPIGEKYKKGGEKCGMSKAEKSAAWEAEEEAKELAETEMLGLYNTTPACVEQLQTMIDNWSERYTDEEMELIQQALDETYLSGEEPGKMLATDKMSLAQIKAGMDAIEKGATVTNGKITAAVKTVK